MSRLRRRLSLAVVVLPALLAFAAPPSAHAAWTAPITIAPGSFFQERVAFDPSGNAIFAYTAYDRACDCERVQTRIFYANGTLSAPQFVSPPGGSAYNAWTPSLAIDQGGNAVYAWTREEEGCQSSSQCGRVQIRVRFANGSMSAIKTLSDPGRDASYPEVAVDPNGNATAVWSWSDFPYTTIQTRRRSASGTLGPLLTISDPKKDAEEPPHVAVDQSGNAIFVFNQQEDPRFSTCISDGCRLKTRVLSAGGTLSAIQTLTPAGRSARNGQLGVDQNGNAIFAWSRPDGTTDCPGAGCARVQARVRRRDGTLSIVQTLSDPGQNSYGTVAVNQLGTAAFVWVRATTATCSYGSPCYEVQTRVRRAGGALSPVQAITSPKPDAASPQVGIDQNGNAVYIWVAGFSAPTNTLRARTRSSSGTLSTPRTVSNSGYPLYDTALAVSPSGRAIAAWYPYLSGRGLEAAVGP